MTDRQLSSPIQLALADLKAYARQLEDDHLLRLIYHLEDALEAAPASGDHMSGDTTAVGNISGSTGIAIGHGAESIVDQSHTNITLQQVFETIHEKLEGLPSQTVTVTPQVIEDAQTEIDELHREAEKGEQADESFLMQRFRNLALMGPDILDVVTATLLNPVAGVALVVRKIAAKAREEAGLAPVS
jgi:hypothetical protein